MQAPGTFENHEREPLLLNDDDAMGRRGSENFSNSINLLITLIIGP